jgi:TPR repeat protein
MYFNGWAVEKDYAKALDLFNRADEYGHAEAQCQIGIMYAKGLGVTKDYTQAVSWFTKAHENRVTIDGSGPTVAEVFLGWMYENGYGVQKNVPRALDWYRLAAARHSAEAKAAIARLTKK